MKSTWTVHKFGGSSVADAARYKCVARILLAQQKQGTRAAVVVSAMGGVTDVLIGLVEAAARQDDSYKGKLQALQERHLETLARLELGEQQRKPLLDSFTADFMDLEEVLRGVWIARLDSQRITEFIAGYGELWSAQILHAYLSASGRTAEWLDARRVLVVEPDGEAVAVDWKLSTERLENWLTAITAESIVITGFIASTREGVVTTLKRNGSDYSASIFGSMLDADNITIWTDVDGVLSADPRRVPDAHVIPELSYQEAAELAYFGAKVVHPNTMYPAIKKGIPIWIKNSFKPEAPGTRISATSPPGLPVKGFATIEDMSLINVEGTGMIGVSGVAHKLFGALRAVNVSVVMISQASSEHSICFAVPRAQAELARRTVETAFLSEMHRGEVQTVGAVADCCIIAMVGDGMFERQGVAGQFFGALGKAGVNVRAIAQGASERNISAIIGQPEATKALRAVHSAFYLSSQTIAVGLIGTGLIGSTFLDQLQQRLESLKTRRGINLRVRGIMNSRRMLLDEREVDLATWKHELTESSVTANVEHFVEHVHAIHLPHTVIIDATASSELPLQYENWFQHGLSIITPNKKANAGPLADYRRLRETAARHGRYFLYETNVGAGLPVLRTLRDLLDTGDEVDKIEGILSGTLSYIFNSFDGTRTFSEVVREAHRKGFTEPDPREDLSGTDVARKLVILSREMGLDVEMDDVKVESLVTPDLRSATTEDYLSRLERYDREMGELLNAAQAEQRVLRYVGTIDARGQVSAGLRTFPLEHAFANMTGSDNVVSFHTRRYNTQPMIIRGPGAGPEVTAAGVFSDLLRLASFLGAPL